MADIKENILNATVALNNIKQHNYSIEDYPMCEKESVIVRKALESYIDEQKGQNVTY